MAENSAFWLGSTLGDAASATGWSGPYSYTEYSDVVRRIMEADDNQGFVVTGYNNNLEVTESSPAAMTVDLDTGAANIRGMLYENTASNTLTINANASGNPRIDRVVLRITFASQTIRAVVLEGTPAAAPSLPTLTQNSTTYEISLAYIWVANGAASIGNEEIHDEREFFLTHSAINDYYGSSNIIYNSEFMGFSELTETDPTGEPPDGWDLVLTPSLTSTTRPSQMSRGRAIEITTDAASEGIEQTRAVKASTTYTIKLLTKVTSGDVGSIVVTTDSGAPGTMTKYIRRVGSWVEVLIRYTTEADATTMTVQILGLNNTDIVEYGQIILVEGFNPGPFRPIRETIVFTRDITDANWGTAGGGPVSKSSGTTTIDLDVDYQTLVLPESFSAYIRLLFTDSGSAAGTASVRSEPYAKSINIVRLELTLESNISSRIAAGWVPLDSSMRYDYILVATGALTLAGFAGICGIQI